jgi:hypothetical protein
VRLAGAMDSAAGLLRAVRWGRFVSARFWITTLAAIAVAESIVHPANAPVNASRSAEAERKPYVGFSVALRQAYEDHLRSERAAFGAEFDDAPFVRNLRLLAEHYWPVPARPSLLALDSPTGIAVDEARLRLHRLYELSAREAQPQQSAAAQTALECWAARAAALRDRASVAECEERFYAEVTRLEDMLLPLKTADAFHRRLAREYLAYAHYKSAVERDHVDARHFAAKGLKAADAQPVEPEELERWFGIEREEARDLAHWRIRLALALEDGRNGPHAAAAAVALARYDCWIDRAAERAPAAYTAKCRGEFIDALRRIEDEARPAGERIAVHFRYDQLALPAPERATIARAARTALERNAFVSVAALASPRGHLAVEARHAWRRAEAVADRLVRLGIPAERIRLVQRASLVGEAADRLRRVEIVLD